METVEQDLTERLTTWRYRTVCEIPATPMDVFEGRRKPGKAVYSWKDKVETNLRKMSPKECGVES